MTRRRLVQPLFTAGVLVASLLGPAGPAGAAPGDPDRTFGSDGTLTTDFDGGTDQARALVVQPDGDRFQFALARYESALIEGGVR